MSASWRIRGGRYLRRGSTGDVASWRIQGDVTFVGGPRDASFMEDAGGRYLRRGSRDASFTESPGCSACHSPVAHSSAVLSTVLIHVTFR